jgi:hypothetical protein
MSEHGRKTDIRRLEAECLQLARQLTDRFDLIGRKAAGPQPA